MDELTHTFEPGDRVYSDPEGCGTIVRLTPLEYCGDWTGKGPFWTVRFDERRNSINDPLGWIVAEQWLIKIGPIEILRYVGQGITGLVKWANHLAGV